MTDRAAFKDAVREALIDRAEALFTLAWGDPARQGGREWRARSDDALSMQMLGRTVASGSTTKQALAAMFSTSTGSTSLGWKRAKTSPAS